MKKVIITGNQGFIGYHLTKFLVNKYKDVTIIGLDNNSSGSNIVKHERVNSIFVDISDKKNIVDLQYFDLFHDVDCIIHLAAIVGVKNVLKSAKDTILKNIISTDNILEYSKTYNIPTIIASSSEVYGLGLNDSFVFSEDDNVIFGNSHQKRWSYALSKYADEIIALEYFEKYNTPVSVVRFFNISGPKQKHEFGMVIPRFINLAINNKDITIFGDGNQTRAFTHIYNVVECLDSVINNIDKTKGKVINIGNTKSITINEIINYIIQQTNSSSKLVYNSEKLVYNKDHIEMYRKPPNVSEIMKLGIDVNKFKTYKDIIDDILSEFVF